MLPVNLAGKGNLKQVAGCLRDLGGKLEQFGGKVEGIC